jgi:hypothetical protein
VAEVKRVFYPVATWHSRIWKNNAGVSHILYNVRSTNSEFDPDSSILIQQMISDFNRGINPQPVYFYCKRNAAEKERSDPSAVLWSVVRQLSTLEAGGPILEPVIRKYLEKKREGFLSGPLSLDDSISLIVELCALRPLTTIIIDALDECDVARRYDLIKALQTVIHESRDLVKLFISSRDEDTIVCHLKDCPNLEIEASKNQSDIENFVRTEIASRIKTKRLLKGNVSLDLQEHIVEKLCSGAQGMLVPLYSCRLLPRVTNF